jgi:Family of unknown function (DUF5367)
MRRFVWIGLAAWLLATLAIRLWGQSVFHAGSTTKWVVLFGVTAVGIAVPIALLVRSLPTRDAGLRAAVLVVLPGMLLDTGSVLWFRSVFPNLPETAGMPFAALLLWAYAIALLAGAWPGRIPGSSS